MPKIKLLIIDQSISVGRMIKDIVSKDENIEIAGVATEIDAGIEYIQSSDPTIVLLDVNLPVTDKRTVLERVLHTKSLPVIMLSANNVRQTAKTVQAITNGAVDFIKKIDSTARKEKELFAEEIITKIYHASKKGQVRTVVKKAANVTQSKIIPSENDYLRAELRKTVPEKVSLIAIGTSTGGPRALQRIVEDLPRDFSIPILIVQHMPATFTHSLAERLNNIGTIRIKEATDGEVVERGTAYIAPGNYHMVIKQNKQQFRIKLHQEDDQSGHRPSVNRLFESIAELEHTNKIAVVLTGMGKDGAEGVMKIKELDNDAIIIAESNETAVIDGMPSAVVATNCVTKIIRLDEVAKALVDYTK